MAKINRSDVIQKAVNELAFSTSSDKIPTETLDKVQLTYDLNKRFSNFCVNGQSSVTGTLNIILPSISASAEIYITGIYASLIKDATCDLATGNVGVIITPFNSNVATRIINFSTITLTAQNQEIYIPLTYPLRIVNGSVVTTTTTFSLGVLIKGISVIGFTTSSN